MTPPSAGEETVRRGPVEHLAGTGARTVLRAPRNALGLLPILANTSAHCVTSSRLTYRFAVTGSSSGSGMTPSWRRRVATS